MIWALDPSPTFKGKWDTRLKNLICNIFRQKSVFHNYDLDFKYIYLNIFGSFTFFLTAWQSVMGKCCRQVENMNYTNSTFVWSHKISSAKSNVFYLFLECPSWWMYQTDPSRCQYLCHFGHRGAHVWCYRSLSNIGWRKPNGCLGNNFIR